MRVCIVNPRTTVNDLTEILATLECEDWGGGTPLLNKLSVSSAVDDYLHFELNPPEHVLSSRLLRGNAS